MWTIVQAIVIFVFSSVFFVWLMISIDKMGRAGIQINRKRAFKKLEKRMTKIALLLVTFCGLNILSVFIFKPKAMIWGYGIFLALALTELFLVRISSLFSRLSFQCFRVG